MENPDIDAQLEQIHDAQAAEFVEDAKGTIPETPAELYARKRYEAEHELTEELTVEEWREIVADGLREQAEQDAEGSSFH